MAKIRLKRLKDEEENLKQTQNCTCGEECGCNHETEHECCGKHEHTCKCNHDGHNHNHCHCDDDCHCNDDCCDDECSCHDECEDDNCDCCNHDDNLQEAYNYLELAQRIQAEFENYRKRTQSAEREAKQKGIMEAVEKLLPVVDSVDIAKKQVTDESLLNALEVINKQIFQSLESLGVKKIEALGKPFDPNYHNAIMTGEDAEKEADIVLEEYQQGFTLGDKVIRYSVVKVNK